MSVQVIDGLAAGLLGRHVLQRPQEVADLRPRRERRIVSGDLDLGEPEVEHFEPAAIGDHHVAGLQVAVHDARPVRDAQGLGNLPRPVQRLGDGHRAAGDGLTQCAALHQLHNEHVGALVLEDVVDRDDVRVVQRGCGACLPQEEPPAAFVSGHR